MCVWMSVLGGTGWDGWGYELVRMFGWTNGTNSSGTRWFKFKEYSTNILNRLVHQNRSNHAIQARPTMCAHLPLTLSSRSRRVLPSRPVTGRRLRPNASAVSPLPHFRNLLPLYLTPLLSHARKSQSTQTRRAAALASSDRPLHAH